MKKLLVGVIVSCMMLSSTVVFAEETESTAVELNWEDVVEVNDASDVDIISAGDFVEFDGIDCMMWIPSAMKEVELTDEDIENGYIGYYQDDDQTSTVAVVLLDAGVDLEGYKEYLEETDGVAEVSEMYVNGHHAVSYDMPEADSTCMAFATKDGNILEFTFNPLSDEDFQGIIMFMGASIQEADAAQETEAAE